MLEYRISLSFHVYVLQWKDVPFAQCEKELHLVLKGTTFSINCLNSCRCNITRNVWSCTQYLSFLIKTDILLNNIIITMMIFLIS